MDFRSLLAYQKSFELAMELFNVSRTFPSEEKFSLTDQVRRSSRSVSVNIAEAYRKRTYPNHFVSKLTDSDAENSETGVWIDFAFRCNYISVQQHSELTHKSVEVGRLIFHMMQFPEKFGSGQFNK